MSAQGNSTSVVVVTVDCANDPASNGYNTGLAIGSVFIVLGVSLLGFLTPVLLKSRQHPFLKLSIIAAACGGTGVILTVGFIHILGDAMTFLSSPCLPESFLNAYPNWAVLTCCLTIVLLILLDYCMKYAFECRVKQRLLKRMSARGNDTPVIMIGNCSKHTREERKSSHGQCCGFESTGVRTSVTEVDGECKAALAVSKTNRTAPMALMDACSSEESNSTSDGTEGSNVGDVESGLCSPSTCPYRQGSDRSNKNDNKNNEEMLDCGCHGESMMAEKTDLEEESKDLNRSVILFIEASVCSHSIPVGLGLGMSSGSTFTTLLVAVIFHQLLEGFGVGAAVIKGKYSRKIEMFYALLFSFTAPIGIIMGIVLHSSLNTNSTGYLMTVGFVNAIASGMLIYIALEHMNAIASNGKWLRRRPFIYQVYCLGMFAICSAALMIVGKWA